MNYELFSRMIEFCTKRRMVISILALGVLTVLVLILEEKLTSSKGFTQTPTPQPHNLSRGSQIGPVVSDNGSLDRKSGSISPLSTAESLSSNPCWKSENFKVIQECIPCSQFEINSKSPFACQETGLKEIVQCEKSGKVYKSCAISTSIEKRRFWIFESFMLLFTVLSFGYTKFRSSQLERMTIKQIERRLAAGH